MESGEGGANEEEKSGDGVVEEESKGQEKRNRAVKRWDEERSDRRDGNRRATKRTRENGATSSLQSEK